MWFRGDPAGKVGAPQRRATRRGSGAHSPRDDCAGAQDRRAGELDIAGHSWTLEFQMGKSSVS